MKCLLCRTEMKTGRENHRYKSSGLPHVVLVGVELRRCPKCGEYEVVIPHVEELHRTIALAIIQKKAKLTPEEIRYLRKYLGWSGADFARHIGVGPATVSRWENGSTPMGTTSERFLRLLVAVKTPVRDYVEETLSEVATEKPSPLSAHLQVEKNGHWAQAAA